MRLDRLPFGAVLLGLVLAIGFLSGIGGNAPPQYYEHALVQVDASDDSRFGKSVTWSFESAKTGRLSADSRLGLLDKIGVNSTGKNPTTSEFLDAISRLGWELVDTDFDHEYGGNSTFHQINSWTFRRIGR